MAFYLQLDPADDKALTHRAIALGTTKAQLTRDAVHEALNKRIEDAHARNMLVAAIGHYVTDCLDLPALAAAED
jgi:hypothetical protein